MAASLPFPPEWTMTETAHYNGGKAWFGYGRQCVQEPRLSCIDRYYRKDRSVVRTWKVDGRDCADAQAAWDALQVAPLFTDAEIAALALVGDVAADYRQTIDYETLHWLRSKGAIEYPARGRCCRTDVGRAAIASAEA